MLGPSALDGVKVLDLSRLLPGPYCSMILADHGAAVIAVEDKRFKVDGLFFNTVNRNKKHISLNLKSDKGKEIFLRLAQEADVLLEGFRPGVVKRLGVDYQTIKAINSKIIYCSITGYGQTGPLVDRVGHDVNYLSIAGVLDLIGEEGHPPAIPGVQIADIAGGAMNAAIGILMALYARERTGQGQYIDISMTDGVIGLLTLPQFFKDLTGKEPRKSAMQLSHRYGCYNTYETADNRYLAIGAVENRFWKKLCDHLGISHYTELQYDEGRRDEIILEMRALFKRKTLAQWDNELNNLEVCYAKIQTLNEVLSDPLFLEREMVMEIDGQDGHREKILGIPVKLSETPGAVKSLPEPFGASTREVLVGLGYSEAEIEGFIADDVI